jgi:predicted nuclease of predicted toxin-antitoxin system
MRCKIDEHLPLEIKDLLVQHQHDSVTVAEQGMAGSIDPDVAQVCRKEARALLTLDLDFSDIRTYPRKIITALLFFGPPYRASPHSCG